MARTKGTKQLGVEVSESLLDEFKGFCESRGEKVRYHLEMALRRHLDNPPPPPRPADVPPLPPITSSMAAATEEPEPKKPAPKKGKK